MDGDHAWSANPNVRFISSVVTTVAMMLFVVSACLAQTRGVWELKYQMPKGNSLYAVCTVTNASVVAVGQSGEIMTTTDTGQHWLPRNSGTSQTLRGCVAESALVCAVGDSGIILLSSNQGASWTPQNSGVNRTLRGVDFINSKQGCIVGDRGTILASTDGGNHWALQPNPNSANLNAVHLVSDSVAFCVGDGGVCMSYVSSWNTDKTFIHLKSSSAR